MKVIFSAPYLLPVLDRFLPEIKAKGIIPIIPDVHERLEEEDLLKIIGDVAGTVCGDDRYTEKVIAAAPKLKVISKWGTGIDSINKEACAKKGIQVLNTPNAFTEPVAASTFSYLLEFCRNSSLMTEHMRKGQWKKIQGHAPHEWTLGIVGLGNIGKRVSQIAHAFRMKIIGYDPIKPPQEFLDKYQVNYTALENVLSQADVLTFHCDLNKTSEGLLNKDRIKLMKKGAYVINTARGPIIKEKDLIEALKSGQIAGAGLDVFEDEPLPSGSYLREHERVFIAPHNSNSSPFAYERIHRNTLNNLYKGLGL